MAYDLEGVFDQRGMSCQREELLAGALPCSCGFQCTATYRTNQGPNTFHFSSSTEMVIAKLTKIQEHKPLFFMGHIYYKYENEVMLTHLLIGELDYPDMTEYNDLFMDTSSKGTFGYELRCTITIRRVNNVDTMEWYRLSN